MNGTTTWQDGINHSDSDDANAAHQQWLALTRDVHIVLTNFGHLSQNKSSSDVDPGFAKLSCVRSKDKNFNSKPGSDDGGNKGDDKGGDKGDDDKDNAAQVMTVRGCQLAAAVAAAVFLPVVL